TANPSSTTTYTVTKTNTSTGCSNTDAVTVTVNNAAVVANAGDDFTKNCIANASGKQIGVASEAGFTYSWSPTAGISDANASNPTANPSSTTTYTVTKTNTSSGCSNTDEVTVTVDNATVVANAGDDFTKTCIANASGKQIGVASEAGFTYSWSPTAGLSDANASNPTANPSSTTTYTVTKTNTSTGCNNTDQVTVTVDNAAVVANAGDDFTKTCISNTSGHQIGVASEAGFTYSWSPTAGLSDASASNPTANPSSTTTYTVTKTKTSTGCSNTDAVTVTVNNAAVVANAGDDFTKTCIANTSGKQIGQASEAGFTYSWSPATGLSNANASNPTANPSSTTTYTVTKTNTSSGCSNIDNITVTVNTDAPGAPTICVVQPSLCGPATGSITILSPLGADYEYSIDNGANWQSGTVFNNLAAGSVTGIKVKKLSSGCISTAANCDASACSQSAARLATTTSTQNNTQTLTTSLTDLNVAEGQTMVKAFPNPFSDRVKFVVTASEAGNGSLELFNLFGQKVKTVFQGRIQSGANTFQANLPLMKSAQLIYVLRVGDKKVTGKLLQLNQ
ncbi:MAG TPA: T9SS type A sorting domain-containing protein, partial [Niastella sp.]